MTVAIRNIYRHLKIYLQYIVCRKRAAVAKQPLEKDIKLGFYGFRRFAWTSITGVKIVLQNSSKQEAVLTAQLGPTLPYS